MQYVCRIGTPEGRILEEVHQAPDPGSLRSELERKGFHVFEVRPRGVGGRMTMPRLGRGPRPVSLRALLLFNQELAALLGAGLPLVQALDLLLERLREPQLKKILGEVRERVRGGSELSDAFAEFGELLPPLYPSTLKAGERSGELEGVLRRFIRYQRLVMTARKKVVSALIYPAVLVGLSVVMIGVMTLYVMPRFTSFYSDLDVELPLLTRFILGISNFVSGNWLPIFLVLVVGGYAIGRWRRSPVGLVTVDRWRVRLPVLGLIFHRLALAEFCRALSTLLAGGIPLLPSLETAVSAVGNRFMRQALTPTVQAVREGSSLHAALDATGEATDIVVDMAKVGEATGALDVMLSNVADFFDEEVETTTQRIVGLIEPIMLVVMGLVVALLLLSVYLPLFGALGKVG